MSLFPFVPLNGPKLLVRRFLSALARRILRARSRPFPLEAAAVTLVIAPHQDDETLGGGGLIPLLLGAGHPVHISYLTDGSASHPGEPTLAARRQAEARTAMALLGVAPNRLEFLAARDGTLDRVNGNEAAVIITQLAATLQRVRPTLVLLPCRADGSSEHAAAFRLFAQALGSSTLRPRVLEFPVWSWWNPLLLRQPLCTSRQVWRATFPGGAARKRETLAAYASQVQPPHPGASPMLTAAFLSFFCSEEEFFFEY